MVGDIGGAVSARDRTGTDAALAARLLAAGELVAFPTETVYGLGADARDPKAVGRIFDVKGRPHNHPLIVHLAGVEHLDRWAGEVPVEARMLADAFWPGPLTMILPRATDVPDAVTGGHTTVGLRVPDHPLALEMLAEFGSGVAAPSANRFGRVSPTTAGHVLADLGADVAYVLDGGPCRVGVESTIVDLSGDEPEVLRPGGVGFDRLSEVLGYGVKAWQGDRAVAAPGTLDSHYAPDATVELVTMAELFTRAAAGVTDGRRVGVLAPRVTEGLDPAVIELEPAGDAEEFAQVIYGRLRQADRLRIDLLLVVGPEPRGVGIAVLDRLARAAARA